MNLSFMLTTMAIFNSNIKETQNCVRNSPANLNRFAIKQ